MLCVSMATKTCLAALYARQAGLVNIATKPAYSADEIKASFVSQGKAIGAYYHAENVLARYTPVMLGRSGQNGITRA